MADSLRQAYIALLKQVLHLGKSLVPLRHLRKKTFVLVVELKHMLRHILTGPDPRNQLFIIHLTASPPIQNAPDNRRNEIPGHFIKLLVNCCSILLPVWLPGNR